MVANNATLTPAFGHKSIENIGLIDPSVRVLLAIGCIAQMFLFEEIQAWQPYVVGFGVYLVLTVIMRQDPIYALFYESGWIPARS